MTTGPGIVVGGGSGIGAAVAAMMRDAGTEVVVWDLAGRGDLDCDVGDPEQIVAATKASIELIGSPATLTITAGVGHSGMMTEVASQEWDRVMNVNVRGPWLTMRALAPLMAGAGGSMVVTSSISGRLSDQAMGVYCASKAALDMVVKVAAREWAPLVRVNAVAPGVTDTPMLGRAPIDGPWLSRVSQRTALERIGTPQDIAEAVLAVHGMTWVTGQIIECDGGLGLFSPIDPLG
jgi:NAD(P)-dependent dehydrogenase (short-subunit alcohol dehydrogenase family)